MPDDEEIFRGGVNEVRRIGSTVVRPAGEHTPSVHRLLVHLREQGFERAPEVVDLDDAAQTETLTFLAGEVGTFPLAEIFRSDLTLIAAATLLRSYHDATVGFPVESTDVWFLPPTEPAEVICHGDFAPYNCAMRADGQLQVFDFDTAHPGPRLADLGYAAYRWVPLTAPDNPDGFGNIADQSRRLGIFCDTYGVSDRAAVLDAARTRLGELIETMRRLAANGHPAFANHLAAGHDHLYLTDIAHITTNADRLTNS